MNEKYFIVEASGLIPADGFNLDDLKKAEITPDTIIVKKIEQAPIPAKYLKELKPYFDSKSEKSVSTTFAPVIEPKILPPVAGIILSCLYLFWPAGTTSPGDNSNQNKYMLLFSDLSGRIDSLKDLCKQAELGISDFSSDISLHDSLKFDLQHYIDSITQELQKVNSRLLVGKGTSGNDEAEISDNRLEAYATLREDYKKEISDSKIKINSNVKEINKIKKAQAVLITERDRYLKEIKRLEEFRILVKSKILSNP